MSKAVVADNLNSDRAANVCVPVSSDSDLVTARREGRLMAEQLGFSASEATLVASAISELARNIVKHARNGEIHLICSNNGEHCGITVVATDNGPGIANVKLAMQNGYSTSGGLGLGLPGVRRVMDDFDITSKLGHGTTISVTKWKRV